jgi:arginyl-tRNA synthetase
MTMSIPNFIGDLQAHTAKGVSTIYGSEFPAENISISSTRKEFEGEYTIVVFPFSKMARKKPEAIGEDLGQYLVEHCDFVASYNVIKGFLNLSLTTNAWKNFLSSASQNDHYGRQEKNGKKVMVEFSSPNTNKPLHLGHIRNILLGWSAAQLFEAVGYEVIKTQIVNDRGIAVCKSMLAWQRFSEGETPESSGTKSDHFVGKYYVLFDQKLKEEYKDWQTTAEATTVFEAKKKNDQSRDLFFKTYKNDYFNEYSELGQTAREMLLAWEAGDSEVRALWAKMNAWVYAGFAETYQKLGVHFDKNYYESDTWVLGKEAIEKGLEEGVFYQKEDNSTWIDLTDAKLDHKIVLRGDGTSVYLTQDIGTAQLRNSDFAVDSMIYVVGDEQNYHFKVLFEVLKRLGEPYADSLYHLSYGMVDLPTGRMKSREGTVVDADDLVAEVLAEAEKNVLERGGLEEVSDEERADIIRKIGLAALKFFIIKVQPQKRMVFNPQDSVDMQGQTGPYVQNAYVRIQSILRRVDHQVGDSSNYTDLQAIEKELLSRLYAYPTTLQSAAENIDPSEIANYLYELAKTFHKFYHDHPILKAETEAAKQFRLQLSQLIAKVLKNGMAVLGIEMPERM